MVGVRSGRLEHWLLTNQKEGAWKSSRTQVEILGKYQFWKRGNSERIALRYMVVKKNNQELEITSTSKTRGSQNEKMYHRRQCLSKGGSYCLFFFFLRNCTPQTKEEALEVRNLIYEPNFHLFTSLSPHFYLQVAVILVQENKTSQNEE